MSTFTSEPGTRLGGRYRLEDRIAAAAGWAAWKAIDETLARAVTVFTFAPGFPRIREVVTAARAASRLNDARLTQVFDVEDDDWDRAYIVMEWPAGDSLDDLLAAGPLDPGRGALIVAEAASALSVAHAAGLVHLCLTPESLRWTAGGGVKVVGLGIDAALAGVTAEDPALTDTRGLGRLLYAALTGHWPGPDYPALPPAPFADGLPRSPRQVRAGVPAALDEVTCQALLLRNRGSAPALSTPGQLARALSAAIPPVPIPQLPAPPPPTRAERARDGQRRARDGQREARDRDYWPEDQRQAPPRSQPRRSAGGRRGAGSRVRTGAVALLVVIVMVGVVAAAAYQFRGHPPHTPGGRSPASPPTSATAAVLTPLSAHGFDETNTSAGQAIDGDPATSWQTQWYRGSPFFGGLKTGSGLILNMGHAVKLSTVTITFGPIPGADVQIKIGNVDQPRGLATAGSMTTVGQQAGVSGTVTFPVHSTVSGKYVLIWFTKLPPLQGSHGSKFEAEIFNIVLHGSD